MGFEKGPIVTLVQWNALREIDRNPAASMHLLAELTFNPDQAFGTLAHNLLRAGLIKRQQGQGRVLIPVLTERGPVLLMEGKIDTRPGCVTVSRLFHKMKVASWVVLSIGRSNTRLRPNCTKV